MKKVQSKELKSINKDLSPVTIIIQSELLSKEDMDALKTMSSELIDTYTKAQIFRTRTEMEVSVLNEIDFPTPQSKYWQAVREQNMMFTEVVGLSYEYRKNLLQIEKLKRKLLTEADDINRELLLLEIEKRMFSSKNQERVAKDRIRELRDWSEIKERESKNMTINEQSDAGVHQLVSYTKRWIKQSLVQGNNGSPGERKNLLGQLSTGLKACKRIGILEDVLNEFPDNVSKPIRESLGNG